MPSSLQHLIDKNRNWAEQVEHDHPGFFQTLSQQQKPEYLWIGCSDSRVPANEVIGLDPGEVFVHRNVANVIVNSDLNALSVIQFAVDVLKIKHIIIVGHYGCGGVTAVIHNQRVGLCDNWLRHVHEVKLQHEEHLAHIPADQQVDALCELNVIEQVGHTAETTVAQDAWARGQSLAIHGWCYGLKDGIVKDLNVTVTGPDRAKPAYQRALKHFAPAYLKD